MSRQALLALCSNHVFILHRFALALSGRTCQHVTLTTA